jgi:flagellar motor switch protein FliG
MSLNPGQKLNGPEKAAVLLLSLSEEYAGRIMAQLEDYEIRDVSLVMATLGSIPSDVVEKVYVEFAEGIFTGGQLVGTYNSTERALMKVMAPDKVESIMEEIRGPAGRTMWDKMGNIDEETLAGYLKNEYPQTIAVVLSKIKTGHAAKVITLLPEELAADVMLRLLKMDAVQKEILNDIEHTLKTEFMSDVTRASKKDPFEMLADIFNAFDRNTEEKYMTMLEERSSEAAERIKSLMFTFDDLVKLDSSGIQTVIKTVDKVKLSLALKGSKQEIKDLFFGNMSERAAKILKEDMEALGMVKLKNVDEAQLNIVNATKELADRGEIIIPDGDEEEAMIE